MKSLVLIFTSAVILFSGFGYAEAQAQTAPFLCTNSNYSVIRWAEKFAGSSNYTCAGSTPDKANTNGTIPLDSKSVCVTTDTKYEKLLGIVSYSIRPLDSQSCSTYNTDSIKAEAKSISNLANPGSNPTTPTTSTSSANYILCQKNNYNNVAWPVSVNGTIQCSVGYAAADSDYIPVTQTKVCLLTTSEGKKLKVTDVFGGCGYLKAQSDIDPITKIIEGNPPNTTSSNPSGGTTNSGNPASGNTSNTRTPPSSSITTGTQGSCPDGFWEKGPLCVPANPFANGGGIAGTGSVAGLATLVISILLGLAGMICVIMVIIGGYYWMTARGNETQVTNGRKTVINALIGLVIIVVSYAIVQAVTNFLTTGS